jgi:AraC-like DNA-binding protein
MLTNRHDLLSQFSDPVFVPHPVYSKGVRSFSCLLDWKEYPVIDLPKLRIEIKGVDYLEYTPNSQERQPLQLHFQNDSYCLWYQVDGNGILQNTSRNVFGTARPGLLGIMERGQRYTYLHQKGAFEGFLLAFAFSPARTAKCYWNSGIEGKTVLDKNERSHFENMMFDLLLVRARSKETLELLATSRLLELLSVLFKKGLIVIQDTQFPKNKQKSLVTKAKAFMELNYARIRHQNDLQRECGVDINYLNILFTKETGVTLYDYLVSIRLERAKHLLETTDTPVADIASRTGYPNANSFSRAFKHREKKTPMEYRRSSRGVFIRTTM